MEKQTLTQKDCRFEGLSHQGLFAGLGAIWIGSMQVRSGRLPERVS